MGGKNTLLLVDGSSYLYRAYHGYPKTQNSKKRETGAMRGVMSMLRKTITEYDPVRMAVIFDHPTGSNTRKEIYPEYKANRSIMPEDLQIQVDPLYEMIRALGIPLLSIENVEADDVIGTLSVRNEKEGNPTIISTGDKDMSQLITEFITLINTMSGETTDITRLYEKYGIFPESFISYLALVGDKADNIPGAPGIGDKTARVLLGKHQTLFGIYNNIHNLNVELRGEERIISSLLDNKDLIELSRQLATIDTAIPLEVEIEDLKLNVPDYNLLHELFIEHEFFSWVTQAKEKTWIHKRKPSPMLFGTSSVIPDLELI